MGKEPVNLLSLTGENLDNEEKIAKILYSLYEVVNCGNCGTRIRFGDYECPHCGADVDDELRLWAARLLNKLTP